MKKFLAAMSGLLAIGGTAFAADMPLKAPIAPLPAPNWTGCYAEAGYGYGMWNQSQHTETFPGRVGVAGDTVDGGRGWLGRFGGGCDYQFSGGLSSWVVGVLGEYDVMGVKGTDNFQNIGVGGVFGAPVSGPRTRETLGTLEAASVIS